MLGLHAFVGDSETYMKRVFGNDCLLQLHKRVFSEFILQSFLTGVYLTRCVAPCAAKTCAVRPVFGRVIGKLGAADPKICSKGHESKC